MPLVDARKTSLTGVQNSTKKIGSPLRGSWTMLRIVVGSNPPPLGKKLDPPLTPIEASKEKNENKVWLNLYSTSSAMRQEGKEPKFSVGDKVRIFTKKTTFEKGYTPRWTEEIFTIDEVLRTDPPTYKLNDYNDESIQG